MIKKHQSVPGTPPSFEHIYKQCLKGFCVFYAVDVVVQWCSQGDLLAVAGMEKTLLSAEPSCPPTTRNALVKFYNVGGEHIYTLDTPAQVINFNRVDRG